MPGIRNASDLTPSAIADQLTADGTNCAQEIRAKDGVLYVKEKKAPHTFRLSRRAYRSNAITLVRQGLATEFNITTSQARQILSNVFGKEPRRVTVDERSVTWRTQEFRPCLFSKSFMIS